MKLREGSLSALRDIRVCILYISSPTPAAPLYAVKEDINRSEAHDVVIPHLAHYFQSRHGTIWIKLIARNTIQNRNFTLRKLLISPHDFLRLRCPSPALCCTNVTIST